ncbi:protein-tyrosine phosphatase-like protein [Achaetomium macrosporum]|uniref:protein-tyrosine-phosphatase n=1 Tax=Achaetomium macrosporum TaxID=79813 RepID=A0AAN7HC57_9PEZI|nr:protein-tyrosine phosphatase-like protein [Achaetomium macrosporum]
MDNASAKQRLPISEIEPGLFLGDLGHSYDVEVLVENRIGAMVSMSHAKSALWSFPRNRALVPEACHMFIACVDTSTQDLLAQLPDICDFIDRMRCGEAERHNVLVHCTRGFSRSATVVVAYLRRKYHQPLDAVLASVRKIRKIKPNPNFMDQLAVWAEVDYEFWEDAAKTIPKPPYAAYLARRAEALKAKGLTGNEPTCSLD